MVDHFQRPLGGTFRTIDVDLNGPLTVGILDETVQFAVHEFGFFFHSRIYNFPVADPEVAVFEVADLEVAYCEVAILEAMEILVLGGSGLVGSELLRQLQADRTFTKIITLGRKELSAPLAAGLYPETVMCCLGTTIKTAGSQEAFREVDHHLPIRIAREARRKGARHFVVVSAMGADPQSRIFYNRVKGEMEAELQTLGYPHVTIIHPSLLLGRRKQPRAGERIASVLMRLFKPLIPKKWQAVDVKDVARVMIQAAIHPGLKSVRVIENDEIVGVNG